MKIKTLAIIGIAAALTGCAAPITINYAPSSTMSLEGELEVGDFKYLPGINNPSVQPNQIRNTALGSAIFEKNIDEYFETALFTESRFVGIKTKSATNVVSGDIIEFLLDDLGYSVDWTLDVKYVVTQNDKVCFDKVKKIAKNTAKFTNVFGTLNEIIKLNIEQAFADPEFVACVASK